jgi:hypothetical protein
MILIINKGLAHIEKHSVLYMYYILELSCLAYDNIYKF